MQLAKHWFWSILISLPTDIGEFIHLRFLAYARLMSNVSFRGYDAAFVLKQISNQAIKDGMTDEFMSDEDINEWLRIYKENLNDENASLEELLFEVNLMLPSVALSEFFLF